MPTRAAVAVAFFRFLRHFKGEWSGDPIALDPWQVFVIGSLYGWWSTVDQQRRFRTAYVEIPRGNGKSTIAAGVALLEAFALGEPGAEVYCAATTRKQARIVFEAARNMVQRAPELKDHIRTSAHSIWSPATLSKIEPVSADADYLDGLRPQAVVIDELHAHTSAAVVDVMTSGTGTRRQPLIFEITTAGVDRMSICWRHHDYTERVVRGLATDDQWFGFVASADEADDWKLETTWRKANPGYGIQVKPEQLQAEARKAAAMPAAVGQFCRYYLNLWLTTADNRAIDLDRWAAGAREFSIGSLAGRSCYLGLDLSMSTDLTAAVFWFPDEDDLGVSVWPVMWVPSDALWLRSQRDRVEYDAWEREGYLQTAGAAAVDYDVVAADLLAIVHAAKLDVLEVGYDRYNAAQFVGGLERATSWSFVDVPQSVKAQSEPTKRVLSLLADGRLKHPNNPVLNWCAGNCALDQDVMGNCRFSKKHSRERIDPMVAAVNAAHRWIAGAGSPRPVYSGLTVLPG